MERPHVVVNMAMTADGKVDTVARRGARISSDGDARRVDELRAASDAIMVGGRTLLAEDPRLTVRSADLVAARLARGKPAQPARVGVVSELTGTSLGIDRPGGGRFLRGEPARVVLFTTDRTPPAELERFRRAGTEAIALGDRRVDLPAALRSLASSGVERLLVEGGGTLVEALLRAGLVEELELFVAPIIVGGRDAPTPAGGPGFPIEDAIRLRLVESRTLDAGGLVIRYRVVRDGDGGDITTTTTTTEGD